MHWKEEKSLVMVNSNMHLELLIFTIHTLTTWMIKI